MPYVGKEGPFVAISLAGTVQESKHFTALLWKEYGKSDKRWLVSDPTIVSLEFLTVVIDGPLTILLVYAIIKNKFYRHYVQIVLCVCELYGGWMTFCPEWLTGSPSLVTDNPMYLWVYLIFFNGLWVVIPFALMWQSWKAMENMSSVNVKSEDSADGEIMDSPGGRRYNLRSRSSRKEA